jgi:hypothetical protein
MRQFQFSLFDPPEEIRSGVALSQENMLASRPFAAIFADDSLKEICRLYGYLMLLGQNLEVELRVCLGYVSLALSRKGLSARFIGDPDRADFADLIRMFESQLDTRYVGSRRIVGELHRARKLRNRLAHGFLVADESRYFLTPGGRESVLQRLKRTESVFFPLIMIVNLVGRAYAAEIGMTTEYIKKLADRWKAEQRQIETDLKEAFEDENPDAQPS